MALLLDPQAEADLDNVPRADLHRLRQALRAIEAGAENLNVAPLEADPSWLTAAAAGHWIVFRSRPNGDVYVARIVTRRELTRLALDL